MGRDERDVKKKGCRQAWSKMDGTGAAIKKLCNIKKEGWR